MTTNNLTDAMRERAHSIACRFHELYEQLAPMFDYETRKESAVAWNDVPENNRNLMVEVVYLLLKELNTPSVEMEAEISKLLTAAKHALRSYQFGNSAPDLAESTADAIEKYLAEQEQTK